MAHELIEKWSFPAQAETEEEKEKRLLEFWKAMDAASFWVEVEELEAGKLGLIKSNAESIDTPFFQVYIGEEKGIKPPVLQSSLVPFREAAGDALLNIASTGEVGLLLVDSRNQEQIYLEYVTVYALAALSRMHSGMAPLQKLSASKLPVMIAAALFSFVIVGIVMHFVR
ncbi:hypothetical protein PS042_01360 [Escherichia albertii]|uniref:hypothetical protein n=1 Tax=Escherichia albertii TaxID=208962 RepID=UPI0007218D27|nr:hypothetical protein [Escherichia albertii]EEW0114543.1 hypothetical protein [Escherichia albertii]EFB7455897.1 hypothetical protein [Escherichia albertii]EFC7613038.1 hypothetical protein [Escherichia albertii]EFO0968387.1 hypothetical protein [Escherichia albertii]EFO1264310.1 hypothetical protein [Escherichia albertii]